MAPPLLCIGRAPVQLVTVVLDVSDEVAVEVGADVDVVLSGVGVVGPDAERRRQAYYLRQPSTAVAAPCRVVRLHDGRVRMTQVGVMAFVHYQQIHVRNLHLSTSQFVHQQLKQQHQPFYGH